MSNQRSKTTGGPKSVTGEEMQLRKEIIQLQAENRRLKTENDSLRYQLRQSQAWQTAAHGGVQALVDENVNLREEVEILRAAVPLALTVEDQTPFDLQRRVRVSISILYSHEDKNTVERGNVWVLLEPGQSSEDLIELYTPRLFYSMFLGRLSPEEIAGGWEGMCQTYELDEGEVMQSIMMLLQSYASPTYKDIWDGFVKHFSAHILDKEVKDRFTDHYRKIIKDTYKKIRSADDSMIGHYRHFRQNLSEIQVSNKPMLG